MEIYIVIEVHDNKWHHTTVHSSHEEAYDRVQYLLKGYKTNKYLTNWRWEAYYDNGKCDLITIEHYTYLPGHDEWVFNL